MRAWRARGTRPFREREPVSVGASAPPPSVRRSLDGRQVAKCSLGYPWAMRIAEVSPPWLAVPPRGYGGVEWVVALLADGLVEHGHEVTLFATGDSRTKAAL